MWNACASQPAPTGWTYGHTVRVWVGQRGPGKELGRAAVLRRGSRLGLQGSGGGGGGLGIRGADDQRGHGEDDAPPHGPQQLGHETVTPDV